MEEFQALVERDWESGADEHEFFDIVEDLDHQTNPSFSREGPAFASDAEWEAAESFNRLLGEALPDEGHRATMAKVTSHPIWADVVDAAATALRTMKS